MPLKKSTKDLTNEIRTMTNIDKDTSSTVDKILGDVTKSSATKQILLGATAGWCTGFAATKLGKVVAITIGGGIILLQIANDQGYIKLNWDKVNRKLDKVVDKVEEQVTGEGPSWTDKMERYVDKKLDKAEKVVKSKQTKAKRWWSGDKCQTKEIHIFLVSFIAGLALGMATS